MPLASVQELDAKFLVIETSMKVIWLERELEELEEKCQITAEKKSTGYIDRWEKSYSEAVWTIHGYSHVPLVCAVMVKVVDLLVGPLRWSHVASYYAIVGVTALAHKQRPTTPIIIVAFPSIMPAVVSGSLTKLAGAFFCFELYMGKLLGPYRSPLGTHRYAARLYISYRSSVAKPRSYFIPHMPQVRVHSTNISYSLIYTKRVTKALQ
jgi:hypothetical protein